MSDWIWRELLQSVNPWSLLKKQSCRLTRENFSVNAARQSDAEYELTGGYSSINAARRSSYKKQRSTPQVDSVQRCEFCGITSPSHVREECPALTRECHKCKQVGHFAAVCKLTRQTGKAPKAVGYVSLHRAGTRQEDQLVPISVQHGSNPPSKVCWLPDSGAEIDAMSGARLHAARHKTTGVIVGCMVAC